MRGVLIGSKITSPPGSALRDIVSLNQMSIPSLNFEYLRTLENSTKNINRFNRTHLQLLNTTIKITSITFNMKGIFSAATFVAIISALAAAAPFKAVERETPIFTKGADFIRITSEANPQTDEVLYFGTQTAVIARTNGQNEFASYVSFA